MRPTLTWLLAVAGIVALGSLAESGRAQEEEEKVFDADFGPAAIDTSDYPGEMQELYRLYAKKCSKCHTLARSINSEYRGDDWNRYVARMSRKPNSGISPGTGAKIQSFLQYHFDRVNDEE
jgi:hypothetical protein